MPKRTNEFQQLIALIEASLNGGAATVQESRELVDKITGARREVDVVVSDKDAVHPILVGIECRGGLTSSRPVTVEWVEQMWGKHLSLPTDKLVLVAKAGFTRNARTKGQWLGVECVTLEAARSIDWDSTIQAVRSLEIVNFLRPHITHVTLVLPPGSEKALNDGDIPIAEPSKIQLITPEGDVVSAIETVVEWVKDPDLLRALKENAFADSGTIFEFERALRPGICVRGLCGEKHAVRALRVEGKCHKSVGRIQLQHSAYRNAAVATGGFSFFDKDVAITVSERQGHSPAIALSIKPTET